MMKTLNCFIFLFALMISQVLPAQESKEELAQSAANPLADLISFPFQNNLNMNYGPYNRNMNVLNIQPVIPFANGKIITRTIFPIVRNPDFTQETGKYASGLSDIVFTAFYTPKSKTMWGIGPVLEIPTGGEKRGSQKWSAGPSFLILKQPGDWTFGVLINNAWSFAGNKERDDVKHMLLNLFIVRQLGDGWYVNSAPIIQPTGKRKKGSNGLFQWVQAEANWLCWAGNCH